MKLAETDVDAQKVMFDLFFCRSMHGAITGYSIKTSSDAGIILRSSSFNALAIDRPLSSSEFFFDLHLTDVLVHIFQASPAQKKTDFDPVPQ